MEPASSSAHLVTALSNLRNYIAGRRNLRAHAWQSLANYFQQGFGIVFGVLLARILDPPDFGAFAFTTATVILVLLPLNWSLSPSLVADGGRTPNLYRTAAAFAWGIVLVRLLIVVGLVGWFWFRGQHQFATLCLLVGIVEAARELNNVQRACLEGMGNFKPNLVSAVVGIVFSCAVVIPAALATRSVYCLTLPGLGGLLADAVIYRRSGGRSILVRPRWMLPPDLFQSGFWVWVGTMCEVAFIRIDKLFTGRVLGQEELGHYNRAFGYAPLSQMVLNSLISTPTVVGLANAQSAAARRRLFWRTAAILGATGFLNWALLWFFSEPLVVFIFGAQWIPSVPIFEAFAGLSLCYSIAWLPVAAMLAARRYRALALVRLATIALLITLLWINRDHAVATSVAWSMQIAFVFQGVVLLIWSWSFLNPPHSSQMS